tara:strand:+ start:140 stop:1648 length:1509 start_codon:yes stop_codon:yes gene_type:complete
MNKISSYFFSILLVLFFSLIFSLSFYSELSSDLAIFGANAYFSHQGLNLYNELMSTNGPLFLIFIRLSSYIFGWGISQLWLVYFFCIFIYLLSLLVLSSLFIKKITNRLLFIFIISGSFIFLNPNVSIVFFQLTFINIAFIFGITFIRNLDKEDTKKIVFGFLSLFFIFLSTVVRIDMAIYYLSIGISILSAVILDKLKPKQMIIIFLSFILFSFFCTFLILNFFGTNIFEFLFHNLTINSMYKETFLNKSYYFFRPEHLKVFSFSGLVFFFIIALSYFLDSIFFKENKNEIARIENIFLFSILVINLLAYFFVNSNKEYHALILFPSFALFISYYFDNIMDIFIKLKSFKSIIIIFVIIINFHTLVFSFKWGFDNIRSEGVNPNCPIRFCEDLNLIKKYNISHMIGANAWLHFLSKKDPKLSTVNHVFYLWSDIPQMHRNGFILKQHNTLLNSKGSHFLLAKENYPTLVGIEVKNKYIEELLENSILIDASETVSIYKIKN